MRASAGSHVVMMILYDFRVGTSLIYHYKTTNMLTYHSVKSACLQTTLREVAFRLGWALWGSVHSRSLPWGPTQTQTHTHAHTHRIKSCVQRTKRHIINYNRVRGERGNIWQFETLLQRQANLNIAHKTRDKDFKMSSVPPLSMALFIWNNV